MTPISGKRSRARPDAFVQKPPRRKGSAKLPSKTKLVHFDPADLQLIERAAKSIKPRPFTSSYYIVDRVVAAARRDLNLPA